MLSSFPFGKCMVLFGPIVPIGLLVLVLVPFVGDPTGHAGQFRFERILQGLLVIVVEVAAVTSAAAVTNGWGDRLVKLRVEHFFNLIKEEDRYKSGVKYYEMFPFLA